MYDEWGTPLRLFRRIQREMGIVFTLDPCTREANRLKVDKFYTKKDDGLLKSWTDEIVFMNPPYSRGNIDHWTKKARDEAFKNSDTVVVGLLPLRSARWFRLYILPYARIIKDLRKWRLLKDCYCGIFFLEKRVRFINPDTGTTLDGYPNFDSILVIWR